MDSIYWIIIIVFIIGISAFFINNLLRQVRQLEQIVKESTIVEDKTIVVYGRLLHIYVNALNELEEIDKRGAFKSDDEVGFIFNTIKETIEQVKFQMESIIKNEN